MSTIVASSCTEVHILQDHWQDGETVNVAVRNFVSSRGLDARDFDLILWLTMPEVGQLCMECYLLMDKNRYLLIVK